MNTYSIFVNGEEFTLVQQQDCIKIHNALSNKCICEMKSILIPELGAEDEEIENFENAVEQVINNVINCKNN